MEPLRRFSKALVVPFAEHVARVEVVYPLAFYPLPVLVYVLVVRIYRLQDIRLQCF